MVFFYFFRRYLIDNLKLSSNLFNKITTNVISKHLTDQFISTNAVRNRLMHSVSYCLKSNQLFLLLVSFDFMLRYADSL